MVDDLLERLETAPPGPELAALMASVDRSQLDGSGVLTLAQARARQIAYEQAEFLADLAEVGVVDWHTPEGVVARMAAPDEFSLDRIAWTLRWSLPTARVHLLLALDLMHRLPAVYAALQAGLIDLARARVFHEVLFGVDDVIAQEVVARLIDHAPQWTCGRLRDRLRYHLHKADPGYAARRYRQAVTAREVRSGTSHDGTAFLSGSDLPVDRAAAADDYLNRLARAAKAAGDPRTLQQLRADAYLDLLAGLAFRVRPSCDPITAAADNEDAAESTVDIPIASASTVDIRADPIETERLVPAWAVDDPVTPMGRAGLGGTAPSRAGDGIGNPVDDPTAQMGPASRDASVAGGVGDPADDPPLDARFCCSCGGVRPSDRRGVVSLTVSLPALMELCDDPAVIPGWGPVLAEIARQVALDRANPTRWQFGVTDEDGRLLHSGPVRRRPRAADERHARMRDRTCRAPYCRRPAASCDTDHRRSFASGGSSDAANLDPLCRHHHRLKHDKLLRLRSLGDGAYRWRAPNGESWEVPSEWTQP